MANIFFKSFCHANKQCLLLHEKIRRSKAHDKQRKFTQYITKNIVASTHCAFEGWRMIKVMKPSMWYLDDNRWEAGRQHNNKLLTKRTFPFFSVDSTAQTKPNQIA